MDAPRTTNQVIFCHGASSTGSRWIVGYHRGAHWAVYSSYENPVARRLSGHRFTQDRNCRRHRLAAPHTTTVFSSPRRPLGCVQFFIRTSTSLRGSCRLCCLLNLPTAPIWTCQVLLGPQLPGASLQGYRGIRVRCNQLPCRFSGFLAG